MRRPRPPCVRFWPQPIQWIGLALGTVCTVGAAALGCYGVAYWIDHANFPGPLSGGVAILQMLGMLERFDLARLAPGSVEAVHLLTEATRLAFADRNRLDREWHAFLTQYDLLLLPTWAQPPFEIGADVVSVDAARQTLEMLRPVVPANVLGLPAAIVPVGFADGLPVGAQLIGRHFADLTCLRGAEALEQSLGTITPIDPVW